MLLFHATCFGKKTSYNKLITTVLLKRCPKDVNLIRIPNVDNFIPSFGILIKHVFFVAMVTSRRYCGGNE